MEALARSGIGAMTLYDLDHIVESNVNRQLHAIDSQFGQAKVAAMVERVHSINPHCRVAGVEAFIGLDNLTEVVEGGFDFVIDCIDSFRIKAALIAACRRDRQRIITLGGAGGQTDPTQIRVADLSRTEQDPLLAKTRKQLRRVHGFSSNPRRRFNVPAVFSRQQLIYPSASGSVCSERGGGLEGSLNCGGYGSVMTVTSAFGMAAVAHVLGKLSQAAERRSE